MPYEVYVDEVTTIVIALLIEYVDANTKEFDTYEPIMIELSIEVSTLKP